MPAAAPLTQRVPPCRCAAQSVSIATVYFSVFFADALVEALQDQLEN